MSISRQCRLLTVNRGRFYYEPQAKAENEAIMRKIDQLLLDEPYLGSRRIAAVLSLEKGKPINRKRVVRLMRTMGVEAVYPKKKTTVPGNTSYIYPYLLRELDITHPDQVWCTDITYIPMRAGHMYLTAVMDCYSRKILSWKLSNTIDTSFCLEALDKAIRSTNAIPEIMNSDQGCQYTSNAWTGKLKEYGIKISMDGKGRWMDNVWIERFWRSLKYNDIYLKCYEDVRELLSGISNYIGKYNTWLPHSALGKRITPEMAYSGEYAALSVLKEAV